MPPKKADLPDKFPAGEVLKDLSKTSWVLGSSVGQGGFGVIYSAHEGSHKPKIFPNVVKIELHTNGPLFVEMHFYMKVAKQADIQKWLEAHKMKWLGLPRYLGSGSHEFKGRKYRFVVTDRLGTSLWNLFEANGHRFPLATVLRIALQTLNTLEYIHSKGYMHGDVKGANLLLGRSKDGVDVEDEVYLVDFGLAAHFSTKPEYKNDPKKAHNGTIEYLSRDAHNGVCTMRSDLEILGFNMLHWLTGHVPWEKSIANATTVQNQKISFMDNIAKGLDAMKLDAPSKDILKKFLTYVAGMKHIEKPDYDLVRDMFRKSLKTCGTGADKGPLIFLNSKEKISNSKAVPRSRGKKVVAPPSDDSEDDSTEDSPSPPKRQATKNIVKAKANSDHKFEAASPPLQKRQAKKIVQRPLSLDSEEGSEDEVLDKTPTPPRRQNIKRTTPRAKNATSDKVDSIKPKRQPPAGRSKAVRSPSPMSVDDSESASDDDFVEKTPTPSNRAKKLATNHALKALSPSSLISNDDSPLRSAKKGSPACHPLIVSPSSLISEDDSPVVVAKKRIAGQKIKSQREKTGWMSCPTVQSIMDMAKNCKTPSLNGTPGQSIMEKEETGPKWKQSLAAQSSHIDRPGEYTSRSGVTKVPKKSSKK